MHYTSPEVYEFIAKQTNDAIVEWKKCRVSWQPFAIYASDLVFYDKISPTFAGKKFQIPTPTLCPEERQRRRLAFRNERKLYKRKCDASYRDIISTYNPDRPYKVYDQKYWWSDKWDPKSYGRDYDFNKSCFQQIHELMREVPRCNVVTDYTELENSDYVHLAGHTKNSYLIFETHGCNNCYYGYKIFDCESCVDCSFIHNSSHCYESIDIKQSRNVFDSLHCSNCDSVSFCINCRNLENCFWCSNLHHGKFVIFNKQYQEKEYKTVISKILNIRTKDEIFNKVYHESIRPSVSWVWNIWFVSGDRVNHSSHINFCFDWISLEWCKYCTIIEDAKDCYDYVAWWEKTSLIYEAQNCGNQCHKLLFCDFVWKSCENILYSSLCPSNNKNLFACVWLRDAQYCILNKQYTAHEYEQTAVKIIAHMQETGEWGEFFHPSLSPFGYNETIAQEYFQLEKVQAKVGRYERSDYSVDPVVPDWTHTLQGDQIPTNINTVTDDILKKILICEISGRPYRIIKQELEFYRKHNIPLPRKHPDIRHQERLEKVPWRTLFLRACDKCWKETLSVYPPEYRGKVYCEEDYNKEVYS